MVLKRYNAAAEYRILTQVLPFQMQPWRYNLDKFRGTLEFQLEEVCGI